MHADVPTLLLMIIVTSAVLAGCVGVVAWGQPGEGLRKWAFALLLHAVAFVLYAVRGGIPDAASVVLANTLLSAALAMLLLAVAEFLQRPVGAALWAGPVLLILVMFIVLRDDYPRRVIYGCLVFGIQVLLVVGLLLGGRGTLPGRGVYLVVLGLGTAALMLLGRSASLGFNLVSMGTLATGNVVQTLTFMVSFGAVLAASVGFVFMTKERADEKNRVLAMQDPLTGAANRRTAIAVLERDMTRALRSRQPLCVLMIDIDHFKTVNDVYGHLAGDTVLAHVVEMIRERLRAQDLVGRYGGEEFLVVLPDTPLDGGRQAAEKLRQGIAQSRCRFEDQPIAVTVSIGLYGGFMTRDVSWDQLILEADRALYRAKEAGRNRVDAAQGVSEPPVTGAGALMPGPA